MMTSQLLFWFSYFSWSSLIFAYIGCLFYFSLFYKSFSSFHLFTWNTCFATLVQYDSDYLMLAVGIADAGHVCVSKQEVECDRQKGKVSHQGEVLPVENHLI